MFFRSFHEKEHYWLGLKALDSSGSNSSYGWINETSRTFSKWDVDHPKISKLCVRTRNISKDGMYNYFWESCNCTERSHVACQIRLTSKKTFSTFFLA